MKKLGRPARGARRALGLGPRGANEALGGRTVPAKCARARGDADFAAPFLLMALYELIARARMEHVRGAPSVAASFRDEAADANALAESIKLRVSV